MNARAPIRLVVSTFSDVLVDENRVRSVRAEDASGSFSLWPGHADFLTVLGVSLVAWRKANDAWTFCAVRGGVMTMSGGRLVQIATREAVRGDELSALERDVLTELARRQGLEDASRQEARAMEIRALSALVCCLAPRRKGRA